MQLDRCRTRRYSPMMFLMSSSSRACFGVAGMVGLTGVAGVLACSHAPGLLSRAGLIAMSLKVPAVVATAGLGTVVVAVDRLSVAVATLSVAVATTVLAKAAGSCGVPSSASPTRALVVSGVGVSQLTAVGSGVGPTEVAGDRGTVAVAAVSAAGGVVGSLPGMGGHPTGEGFLMASPALLLGLRSWSSISRSTVLSPLNSSSAAKHRHGCQPPGKREQVP